MNPWAEIYKNLGRRKSNIVMKKTKIPTQNKTKKCTFCGKPGTTLMFGNEKRTLCRDHIIRYNSRNDKYFPVFKRGSEIE